MKGTIVVGQLDLSWPSNHSFFQNLPFDGAVGPLGIQIPRNVKCIGVHFRHGVNHMIRLLYPGNVGLFSQK